jgi:hypothetical protein
LSIRRRGIPVPNTSGSSSNNGSNGYNNSDNSSSSNSYGNGNSSNSYGNSSSSNGYGSRLHKQLDLFPCHILLLWAPLAFFPPFQLVTEWIRYPNAPWPLWTTRLGNDNPTNYETRERRTTITFD